MLFQFPFTFAVIIDFFFMLLIISLPTFYTVQAKEILEENGKAEQQPLNQSEQNPEKKTSLLRKLDEKKKECAERDAKQQAVKKKRNYDMSL